MAIKTRLESTLRDVVADERDVNDHELYYHHDPRLGELILAHCMTATQGVNIYVARNFTPRAPQVSAVELASKIKPANLHRQLFPWFRTEIATHLDTGEPAKLTIQSAPTIEVNVMRDLA